MDRNEAADRVYRAANELNKAIEALPRNVFAEVDVIEHRTIADKRPRPFVDVNVAEDIPERRSWSAPN